jgi:hypothetical protein
LNRVNSSSSMSLSEITWSLKSFFFPLWSMSYTHTLHSLFSSLKEMSRV